MMVWYGRFRGPTRFGCPGFALNSVPRFCNEIPVPGTTTPDPKPS